MRYADALAELEARQPEKMVPDLDRITALAELMGDPQRTYPTVHVTGTNGKTTTTRLVTALACAHGLVSGAYTSPHLESVTERIAVCAEPIDDEQFGEEYERLLPFLQAVEERSDERVTYFEALTALAYLWFADKPVGLGVFEVGMGGTWDATNLVTGDVAIICPIDLDHPELGSTVAEVAREKAGIVKPGKVAVVREQPAEALHEIEGRAGEVGARVLLEGRDFGLAGRNPAVGGQVLDVRGIHADYEGFVLPLFGDHAGRNAAGAIVGLEALLDRPLSEEAVRGAFAAVAVPGRLEVVGRRPLVVLDGAHNPAGAAALAATLAESFTWRHLHLVIGVSANKDVDGVVSALAPLADRAYAARHGSIRSAPAERVAVAAADAGLPVEAFATVTEALSAARGSADPEDLILVTGSLYTVADARRVLVP